MDLSRTPDRDQMDTTTNPDELANSLNTTTTAAILECPVRKRHAKCRIEDIDTLPSPTSNNRSIFTCVTLEEALNMAKNNLQTALDLATQSEKQAIQQVIAELSIAMISIEKADTLMQPQAPTSNQGPKSDQRVQEKLDKILDILQDQQVESAKTKRAVINPQISILPSMGTRSAPPATHPPTSSLATVASSNDNQWQTVHRARAPAPALASASASAPAPQPPSYLEHRLVITVKDKTKTFDPRMTRNAINQKLQAKGFNDPVVATVNKSRSGESVIITTVPKYKNDVLIEHKDQWESIVDTVNVTKDARWACMIAHGINIEIFSEDQGMQFLKSEIEIFNSGLVLAQYPLWLTKEEARINNRYSSVSILTIKS